MIKITRSMLCSSSAYGIRGSFPPHVVDLQKHPENRINHVKGDKTDDFNSGLDGSSPDKGGELQQWVSNALGGRHNSER